MRKNIKINRGSQCYQRITRDELIVGVVKKGDGGHQVKRIKLRSREGCKYW